MSPPSLKQRYQSQIQIYGTHYRQDIGSFNIFQIETQWQKFAYSKRKGSAISELQAMDLTKEKTNRENRGNQ